MNLLLLISSLSSGGAERVMSEMANYWSSRNWNVSLATWSSKEISDFYSLDPSVKRVHLNLAKNTSCCFDKIHYFGRRFWLLRKTIRQINPDVIISFMDIMNIFSILASRGMSIPVVISERTNPASNYLINWFWSLARKQTYQYASSVVAQTESAAKWLIHNCNVNPVVIPNPLRQLPFEQAKRESLVLSIGSLLSYKGHDILLKSFAKVHQSFPSWRLVILGDGPERNNLIALCEQLQLQDYVTMPGRVKNVEHWLTRAGMVVQASRIEGFPNVLLEAMGMGAPVISTDCASGPAEIIEDGIDGRLVRVDDIDGLAFAMADLMGDENKRKQLGNAALNVRDRFAQERIMKEWESLLFRVNKRGTSNN